MKVRNHSVVHIGQSGHGVCWRAPLLPSALPDLPRPTGSDWTRALSSASRSRGDAMAIVQRTIVARELPALVVFHDPEGDWLIGDGVNDPSTEGACGRFHMSHILDLDASVNEVARLSLGQVATRNDPSADWVISEWNYGEDW